VLQNGQADGEVHVICRFSCSAVESVQTVNRLDEGFRRQYQHRCHHKPRAVAKVAAARRLAVRLYWMLRSNTGYPEIARIESSSR
jgi:hypothetical protein